MWSAWLIVIYTITCLLILAILLVGVFFIREDRRRTKILNGESITGNGVISLGGQGEGRRLV